MRKITSLLSLLFMMMGGVMFAQTEVKSLQDISNQKTYTLVAKRGFLGVKDGKAIFGYSGTPRPNVTDDHFAILKYEEKYYLFNVGKKQFLNTELVSTSAGNTMALKDTPDYDFTLNDTKDAEYPWCFRVPGKNSWLMNMNGSKQLLVDGWSTLDDGNKYKITEVGTLDDATLQEALSKLKVDYAALINKAYNENKLSSSSFASYVGYISEDKKQTIKNAKDEATKNPTKESYEKLLQAIKDNSVGFEANAYYVIESQNNDIQYKYPSTQNMHMGKTGDELPYGNAYDDRVIRRVKDDAPLLPRLWQFEPQNDGTYGIKNANTNCRWANYKGSGELDMPANPKNHDFGHFVFEQIPATNQGFNTTFYIKIKGHMMNANNGDTGNKAIASWNDANDKGNFWSFKKITEVPVKIGATGWASVCFPFAVTIPQGVKAYVAASAQNDVVTLKEITGPVPAKTGILITGTANSEPKFTIATEVAALNEVNLLKGTTTERINFGVENTFALGAKDNGAVFMKNELKKSFDNGQSGKYETVYVPANKAYILTTDLNATAQAASLLQFNFGGEATGIDGVVADDAKETIYYDLNGRRVLYPTQGVYVTNTGKKVFIR